MYSKENFDPIYNFTPEEKLILTHLRVRGLTISELSRLLKIPRTTLYTHTNSLLSRGLIYKKIVGRKTIFSIDEDKLILSTQNKHHETNSGSIKILNSSEEMIQKQLEFYNQKNIRFHVIQPVAALMDMLNLYPAQTFIPINKLIKKNKNVFESIINEKGLRDYLNLYKHNQKQQEEILQSIYGRLNDTTYISDEVFNSHADLALTDNECLIYNWKNKVGLSIKDKDIISLIRDLFAMTKGYGKKGDLNQKISKEIEKLIDKE